MRETEIKKRADEIATHVKGHPDNLAETFAEADRRAEQKGQEDERIFESFGRHGGEVSGT